MLLNIDNASKRPSSPHPVLNLAFRIFFMGAAVIAIISMSLWFAILQGFAPFKGMLSPFYWHGHEMIFGYALAVIAGFLLTAVKTWTNQPMPYGVRLLSIFIFWLLARLSWLGLHALPSQMMLMAALVCDMLFWGLSSYAVIRAVWAARQKRQIGIIAKMLLLWLAHTIFYFGVITNQVHTQQLALHLALYLIIAVVFTIARRVLPFFITKGVAVDKDGKPNGLDITLKNSVCLDRLSLIGLAGFVVFDLLVAMPKIAGAFALLCAIANILRLKNWHHSAIWQKPLLWSLWIAFIGMTASLLIFAIYPFVSTSVNWHSLGLHGLALFGIGLMTLAMMARVSLGHTGRSIHQPPSTVKVIFALMISATLARLMPLLSPIINIDSMLWITWAQLAWISAFVLFIITYTPILTKPRIDGLFG